MADANINGAMTWSNTTAKVTLEAYKILMELLKDCVGLIPNPSVANVMRKEMELGHVNCEMIQLEDAELMRKGLEKQGLRKGVDFIETVYNRPDGERVAAFFYNIKDDEKVRGAKQEVDPQDLANRNHNAVAGYFESVGINPDKTVDERVLKKSLANKGIDINKMLSQEDIATAVSLMSSEFLTLSNAEKTNLAKTLAGNGAIDVILAEKQTGNINEERLYAWSKTGPNKEASISSIKNLTEQQAIAFEKRAEANGLRINIQGPNKGNDYTVYFASKDRDLMARTYAEYNYDLNGKAGEIYQKQLDFEANYHKQAMNAFINQQMPNDEKLPDKFMLVGMKVENLYDSRGNVIRDPNTNEPLQGRNTIEYDNGKFIINGDARDINPNAKTMLSLSNKETPQLIKNIFGDTRPTILTDTQAAEYKREPNEVSRLSILYDAQAKGENGFDKKPIMTADERAIIQEHEKNRVLVENKIQEQLPNDQKMAAYTQTISPSERFYINQVAFTNADFGDRRTNIDLDFDIDKVTNEMMTAQLELDTDLEDTDTFVRNCDFSIIAEQNYDLDNPVNDAQVVEHDDRSMEEKIDEIQQS